MDFLVPETERRRRTSSRWTEDEVAEADEVVAAVGEPHPYATSKPTPSSICTWLELRRVAEVLLLKHVSIYTAETLINFSPS